MPYKKPMHNPTTIPYCKLYMYGTRQTKLYNTMLQDKLYNTIQCFKTNCTIQCYKTIIQCIAHTMLYSKTTIRRIALFNPVDHVGQTDVRSSSTSSNWISAQISAEAPSFSFKLLGCFFFSRIW